MGTCSSGEGPVAVVDTGSTFFAAEKGKIGEVLSKLPPAPCNLGYVCLA